MKPIILKSQLMELAKFLHNDCGQLEISTFDDKMRHYTLTLERKDGRCIRMALPCNIDMEIMASISEQ